MSQENDLQHIIKCTQNRIGMTVREEIASRVLAGMLSRADLPAHETLRPFYDAIWYADALIEELERTKK